MSHDITIRQVAQHAGVSVGTVSRCLNGFANINPDYAQRVKVAVAELGYQQPRWARSSTTVNKNYRTGNIGVYFSRSTAEWATKLNFLSYFHGIETACAEYNMHPLIEYAILGRDEHLPRFLREKKIEGFLINGISANSLWLQPLLKKHTIVGFDCQEPLFEIPQVAPNDHAAGRQVAEYLWSMGHRRIAFIGMGCDNLVFITRRQAIEEFLLQNQAFDPELVPSLHYDSSSLQISPEASPPDLSGELRRLWALPPERRPTAIIVANDWYAIGLYNALKQMKLTPGQDVSVIGFDNETSLCCSVAPTLSSYAIPWNQVAYVATKLLLERLKSSEAYIPNSIQLITGKIVLRQSVKRLN